MTFTVRKASDWNYEETVTFNTLEELKDYQLNAGVSLIINFKEYKIWIYEWSNHHKKLKKY